MGGNSISSRPSVRPTTPKAVEPSKAKVDKLLKELTKLDGDDRKDAITALKAVGLSGLAKALESIVKETSTGGGSRPPERPAPSTYTPPA